MLESLIVIGLAMILSYRGIASLFCLLVIIFILVVSLSLSVVRRESSSLPDIDPVINYKPDLYSEVFDKDGNVIYYFGNEKRKLVSYSEIPAGVVNAFIAAEDKNFWRHNGYDPVAILKAFYINITDRLGRRSIGGSTITQQVVKNLILSSDRTLSRKVQEALLANLLEEKISKERILEIYLNDIYMGYGAYGIAEAANTYFGKEIGNVNIAEAAFLAVLPKAPSRYSVDPEMASDRRKYVLERMLDNGFINQERFDWAMEQPLPIPLASGSDQISRGYIPHFINASNSELDKYIGIQNAMSSGLSIQLTMDPKIQSILQKSLQRGLLSYTQRQEPWIGSYNSLRDIDNDTLSKVETLNWSIGSVFKADDGYFIKSEGENMPISKESLNWASRSNKNVNPGELVVYEIVDGIAVFRQIPDVQGAVVAMSPKSGEVFALTGAFSEEFSEFNRVTMSQRQPGSLLKTFIYGIALENGWTPASPILDSDVSYGVSFDESSIWRPRDHNKSDRGFITLRSGLEYSRNTVTVRLFEDIGFDLFEKYVSQYNLYDEVPRELSVALGSKEVTLMDMVSAYASIANNGRVVEPVFVKSVSNKSFVWNNPELEMNLKSETNKVFDDVTVYQLQSMLNGVTKYGTSWRAFENAEYDSYGKTGTSNSANDVWYVGFTENLVVGVFVGYDTPKPLGKGESGGSTAAPIVRDVLDSLKGVYPALLSSAYQLPNDAKIVEINPDTGVPTPNGFPEILRK